MTISSSLMAQSDSTELSSGNESSYTIVEKMPVFGNCDGHPDVSACSQTNLSKYMRENLKYPKEARKQGVHGVVYVQFIIDQTGDVIDVKVLRGIADGEGCNEEALRVISEMPNWTPGEQRGKKVKVKFTIPIGFRLK